MFRVQRVVAWNPECRSHAPPFRAVSCTTHADPPRPSRRLTHSEIAPLLRCVSRRQSFRFPSVLSPFRARTISGCTDPLPTTAAAIWTHLVLLLRLILAAGSLAGAQSERCLQRVQHRSADGPQSAQQHMPVYTQAHTHCVQSRRRPEQSWQRGHQGEQRSLDRLDSTTQPTDRRTLVVGAGLLDSHGGQIPTGWKVLKVPPKTIIVTCDSST